MIKYIPLFVLRIIQRLDDMALEHMLHDNEIPYDYYRAAERKAHRINDEIFRRTGASK